MNAFIGEGFLIKNDYLAYFFFESRYMILNFLFVLCIVYACLKYLFNNLNTPAIYGLTLAIIVPVFLWHFHPYLLDMELIFEIKDAQFYRSVMLFNFLPLFFLIAYGIFLYRFDRSLGEHINTLMVCFFIINIMNITSLAGSVYQIMVFRYTQYILLINLSFFLITMFRLLNHAYSAYGQLYDNIVVSGDKFGVPIKRKETIATSFVDVMKAYFHERRNTIGFLTLIIVFCINYFSTSLFLKLNMAAFSLGFLVVFFYLAALYQKRLSNGNILNLKGLRNKN